MKRNAGLNYLIKNFSELYWLKPVDIIWDAVTAYHVQRYIGENDYILDLGCGDGLLSALMLGGRISLEYDRFLNIKPTSQKIKKNQSGDIYSNPVSCQGLLKMPRRRIDIGLELKNHHIRVAKSLRIYDKIVKGRFEKMDLESEIFDKAYSIFAFYWGNDLNAQFSEIRRVLKKNGEFLVTMPSEYLFDLHIAKKIADDKAYSKALKSYMNEMDGGRRRLATRYSRTVNEWRSLIATFKLELIEAIPVVNEILFIQQDISQRPFLPMFFDMQLRKSFIPRRNIVKKFLCEEVYPNFINRLLHYEGDKNIRHAYYLLRIRKR